MTVSDEIRRQLSRLARSRRTRTSAFSAARPTHWAPAELCDPSSNEAFTPDGAWLFVADRIDAGEPIQVIPLDKPAGCIGYVMICEGANGERIYVKLQVGSGCVIGRSFHKANK